MEKIPYGPYDITIWSIQHASYSTLSADITPKWRFLKRQKSTVNGIISVLFKITFTSSHPQPDSGSAQNQLFYDHKNKSSFINRVETVNKV